MLLLLACVRSAPPDPGYAQIHLDHPLAGVVWHVDDQRYLSAMDVFEAAQAADYVLLGERHDNPDHHVLQGAILQARLPDRVVFEMVDPSVEQAFQAETYLDAVDALHWEERGWPDAAIYRPVLEPAYRQAQVRAGSPTKAELMAVGMGERAVDLPELPEGEEAELRQQLVDSHCGMITADQAAPMATVQRYKDQFMADALGQRGVLIAGAGHTRRDRGVPRYLEGEVLSVAMTEVVPGLDDPRAYGTDHDILWFTAVIDDSDPCEAFREQLEGMGAATSE